MATTVARLEAVLSADTKHFDRQMDQSKGKMSKMGKVAGAAGLAIFAGLGVVAKRGFDEMKESQEVMAQTEAGLKSTGGVAKVTGKDITGLANRLSKLSGVDDEVIQKGSNLLLTFTKVRNEVGKGNRMFDRATEAALDLSARGFGSMDSTAKMLGKALQDPVRGLTALGRAGVTFDDQQKKVIKGLVEGASAVDTLVGVYEGNFTTAQVNAIKIMEKAGKGWRDIADVLNLTFTPAQQKMMDKMTEGGHTLEAQRLIMKEVEKQVGGSAKAYGDTLPGQMAKAKNAFDEMAAKIMVAVLPAMTAVLQKLQVVVEWLDKNRGAAKLLVAGLALLAAGMIALSLAQTLVAIGATAMWAALTAGLIVIIPALIIGLAVLYQKSETFRNVIDLLWKLFLNTTPIGLAIKHFDTLRDIAVKIWSVLGSIIGRIKAMIEWIKKIDFPKIPDLTPGFNLGGGGKGVSGGLQGAIRAGSEMGLRVSSLFRPGDPGDHGKGKAVDMAGSASAMERFAGSLFGSGKDVIYGGLGYWQDNGRMVPNWAGNAGLRASHRDHVHYSVFDKGGWLMPGLTLAANNTGRPERVGGSETIIVQVGTETLVQLVRNAKGKFERRNGPGTF